MRTSLYIFILFSFISCATYKTTVSTQQQKLITYKKMKKNEKCISIPRIYSGIFYTSCIMFGHIKKNRMQESIYMLPVIFMSDTLILPYTINKQLINGNIILKYEFKEPIKKHYLRNLDKGTN